jgi:hypothetical protein
MYPYRRFNRCAAVFSTYSSALGIKRRNVSMNQRDGANKAEARRAPRKAVSRTVVVVYGERRATVGGTLLNISSSGARIRIPARQELPDGFFLIDLTEKTAYLCVVMNHIAGVYGVKFVNRHPLSSLPPTLGFLSAIWMDFAQR